ncbi:alanine--glyoxylate aminotransferase-like [Schistocerca americana]|uniref:alanine--glyoxylate aminotransferase-like n=1 Tax=Schistocerca americana TaxID=7009 RepID=UPI001F503D21|nr:alanine--glyoxylate aminotransferase-like [Schistocerca americana]
MECTVPPPDRLRRPLVIPYKYMMSAGPSNASARVLHALSNPIIGPLHKEAYEVLDDIKAGLQYVFQTKNEMTFAMCGSGTLGMEASIVNLYEPGDTVLVACNGIWSERAADIAERLGANVHTIETTHGKTFTLKEIEDALQKYKPQIFFIVQAESTTGVFQDVQHIGPLCHKYNCLLIVDTVVGVGGVPIFVDKWDIDVAFAGTQKALGGPTGLAPITFGPRAVKKMMNRKTKVQSFYMDALEFAKNWKSLGPEVPRGYHYTLSMNLLFALREALAEIVEEGLENRWKRHHETAERVRAGVHKLGLELFPHEGETPLNCVTTVRTNPGIDWRKLRHYAMDVYKMDLPGGFGKTAKQVHRIGLMGSNANPYTADFTLEVLKDAIEHCKISE